MQYYMRRRVVRLEDELVQQDDDQGDDGHAEKEILFLLTHVYHLVLLWHTSVRNQAGRRSPPHRVCGLPAWQAVTSGRPTRGGNVLIIGHFQPTPTVQRVFGGGPFDGGVFFSETPQSREKRV